MTTEKPFSPTVRFKPDDDGIAELEEITKLLGGAPKAAILMLSKMYISHVRQRMSPDLVIPSEGESLSTEPSTETPTPSKPIEVQGF